MWLERLTIRRAEKKLQPYRNEAKSLSPEIAQQYQTYLPQITSIYQQTTHWHGTGRYQYQKALQSDRVSSDSVIDILSTIITSKGLMPHRDPWLDYGGETVSLATVRMHGRIYARVHMFVHDKPIYELGDVKYWSRLYFLLLFLWLCAHPRQHKLLIKKLLRPSSVQAIQHRVGTTRKPRNKVRFSTIELMQGKALSSDIEGNYPVLIGVATDTKKLIETVPLTHKVEQRSREPITLKQFTHIEVPLERVAETEHILKQHNVSLPVVPMEFGDIYLADQPLKTLALQQPC